MTSEEAVTFRRFFMDRLGRRLMDRFRTAREERHVEN